MARAGLTPAVLVSVAVLVLAAAQPGAALLDESKSAVNGFKSLNRHLERELAPDDEEPSASVAAAVKKLLQPIVLDWNIKPAIKALVAISSPEAGGCNNRTLKAVHFAATGRLDVRAGGQRVERVLRHYMAEIVDDCSRFAAGQLERLLASLDQRRLEPVFAAPVAREAEVLACEAASCERPAVELAQKALQELAARNNEPLNLADRSRESRAAVRAAFNKYLREPCKYYLAHASTLLDGILALAELDVAHESAEKYLQSQPRRLQEALYHYRRCQTVLTIDNKQFTQAD